MGRNNLTIGVGLGAALLLQSCSGMMDSPEECQATIPNPALPKNPTYLEKQTQSTALIRQTTDGVIEINIPKPEKTEASTVLIKIGDNYAPNSTTGQAEVFTLPVQAQIPLSALSLPESALKADPQTGTFPGISRSSIRIAAIGENGNLIAEQAAQCVTMMRER